MKLHMIEASTSSVSLMILHILYLCILLLTAKFNSKISKLTVDQGREYKSRNMIEFVCGFLKLRRMQMEIQCASRPDWL